MENRVISLRLPSKLDSVLEQASERAKLSVSGGLDLLLRCSIANAELLAKLKDSPDLWGAKLDARIPISTYGQVKSECGRLGISVSVYIRTLLYHLYVTKRLSVIESNGHYTLAYRHD